MDSTTDALPATAKQIAYARSLALRNQTLLPWEVQQDRRSLSAWIDAQAQLKPVSDMDRLPTSKQVAFAEKLARIKRELHQQLGREATDDELAEESGIPAHKIADLLDHSRDPVSLDMPVGNDEEAPLGDFIEDSEATSAENAVIAGLLHSDVRSVLVSRVSEAPTMAEQEADRRCPPRQRSWGGR